MEHQHNTNKCLTLFAFVIYFVFVCECVFVHFIHKKEYILTNIGVTFLLDSLDFQINLSYIHILVRIEW